MLRDLSQIVQGRLVAWIRFVPHKDGYGLPLFLNATSSISAPNGLLVPTSDDALRITSFQRFDEESGYSVSYDLPSTFANKLYRVGDKLPIPLVACGNSEIVPAGAPRETLTGLFQDAPDSPVLRSVISIIDRAREFEASEGDLASALELCEKQQWKDAVAQFERVLRSTNPKSDSFALRRYYEAMSHLNSDEITLALERMSQAGVQPPTFWSDSFYWNLHKARLWLDAESYCRGILTREPENISALFYLTHIVGVHLERPTEADELLLHALKTAPNDINLLFARAEILGLLNDRDDEAIEALQQALTKDESYSLADQDRARILKRLFGFLRRNNASKEDLVQNIMERQTLTSDPTQLNSCAWSLYQLDTDLENAEEMAKRSFDADSDNLNSLHTLLAIQVRLEKWIELRPFLQRWISGTPSRELRDDWGQILPLFGDLLRANRQDLALAAISSKAHDLPWQSLGIALTGSTMKEQFEANVRHVSNALRAQLAAYDRHNYWHQEKVSWPDHDHTKQDL